MGTLSSTRSQPLKHSPGTQKPGTRKPGTRKAAGRRSTPGCLENLGRRWAPSLQRSLQGTPSLQRSRQGTPNLHKSRQGTPSLQKSLQGTPNPQKTVRETLGLLSVLSVQRALGPWRRLSLQTVVNLQTTMLTAMRLGPMLSPQGLRPG